MNPAKSPIFCIDSFEVLNPPKNEHGNLSNPFFQVKLMTKEGPYWYCVTLYNLLQSCKKHAPAEYRYVEQLQWYVANGGLINFQLLQAMEDEGFDVERLMPAYFEWEDWQQKTLPPTMVKEFYQAESILDGGRFAEFRDAQLDVLFGEVIEKISGAAIGQAFQEEVWRTYPVLEELHQRELASFIQEVATLAFTFVTFDAATYEYNLTSEPEEQTEEFEAEYEFSPEGIRQGILEQRRKYKSKPDNALPIRVEVVALEYQWLDSPYNTVTVWYKGNYGGEEFHDFVSFGSLIDEAALKFPELYERIEKLREELVAVRPKEPEIVEALHRDGVDWLPLLESYVNDWVDAGEKLAFDRQIKQAGHYKNCYDIHATGRPDYDEKTLQEIHQMTLLSDRLEDLGYQVLCGYFPDLIKKAKPWMLKSLRSGIHLLVFQSIEMVYQLTAMAAKVVRGSE